jgi:hypothetical protein
MIYSSFGRLKAVHQRGFEGKHGFTLRYLLYARVFAMTLSILDSLVALSGECPIINYFHRFVDGTVTTGFVKRMDQTLLIITSQLPAISPDDLRRSAYSGFE